MGPIPLLMNAQTSPLNEDTSSFSRRCTTPSRSLRAMLRPGFHEADGCDPSADRGAAMVEFAITSIILALLVFGIIEGGLAFRAKLSLSNSADEAARRGAVAGNSPYADHDILQQVTVHNASVGTITKVIVFRATDGLTEPPAACHNASSASDQCNTYLPSDFNRSRADFGNCIIDGAWCPADRSSELRSGDFLGVYVEGRFNSPSGALGHVDLSETSILPLESKGI